MGYHLLKASFRNAQGQLLSARLDLPADPPRAYALFAHCFTCSKNFNAVVHISRVLSGHGIGVLRFDFTGLGESEGDFSETNFTTNVDDLVQAAGYLGDHYAAPALLIGHSLGGAAVLQAAHRLPSVRAVATLGAPADTRHLAHFLERDGRLRRGREELDVVLAGRRFRIPRAFIEDLERTRMTEVVAGLGKALLVLHSLSDDVVAFENGERIFRNAAHPKGFISLQGVDHLLSDKRDAMHVGNLLAAWAERYLPGYRDQSSRDD